MRTIILELSYEQARTIRHILDRIGGDREKSRRKHADEIVKQLEGRGFGVQSIEDLEAEEDITSPGRAGSIWFLDRKEHKHDWVEVTTHEQAGRETHYICAQCPEFKVERTAEC